jgi:hypothetical protein
MIHTRAKNWRNFDPILMQMTASILSSCRIKLIQKFHNSGPNYFAQSCGKNRLKAANLHPEKPFAH